MAPQYSLLALQQRAIRLGLDLQGGIHVVLRVKTEELDEGARVGAVDRAIQIIRTRVDGLGVAEPTIQRQGEDRIIVDLPGYTDADRAEDLIGQTALLEFKLLEKYENATLILERVDSVVHEFEVAISGEPVEETPAVTEETPADTEETSDVMAELMGTDSASDSMDFGFDESLSADADLRPRGDHRRHPDQLLRRHRRVGAGARPRAGPGVHG